jgi:uncharacterized protein DUF202
VIPDPGASAERTRLAWRRTGLSATAAALLAARPAFRPEAGGPALLVAALAMIAWVLMIALAYRRSWALGRTPPVPARRAVPAYALITAVLATLGGVAVLL